MSHDEDAPIRALLADYFARNKNRRTKTFETRQRDFVFHMLDAKSDLINYAALLQTPQKFSSEEASQIVFSIHIHALGHLMEAAKLLYGIRSQFDPPKARRGALRKRPRISGSPNR